MLDLALRFRATSLDSTYGSARATLLDSSYGIAYRRDIGWSYRYTDQFQINFGRFCPSFLKSTRTSQMRQQAWGSTVLVSKVSMSMNTKSSPSM